MNFLLRCFLVFALSLGSFLATGCRQGTDKADQNTLRIGSGAEPGTIDPHLLTDVAGHSIALALFEGLVTMAPDSLEPEPGVAESWEISEDGLVYTFKLRADAKWSNGDPVTADDFIFSYKRILTPALGSQYAYMLYAVRNAEAYFTGKQSDFSEVGIKALDPQTLEITLTSPAPYFLSLLCHSSWLPVHPDTIREHKAETARDTRWTRAGNLVGNGPFTLTAWSPREKIRVEANPHYWDASKVKLDAIEFYPIEDLTAEERAFRAGQIHITESLPMTKIPAYRQSLSSELRIEPYLGTYYFLINTSKPPLDDVKVRQALSLSIDRQTLINGVAHGVYDQATGFVPEGLRKWTLNNRITFDAAKAQKLLAEAGYPNGEGFPSIEIAYNTSENHKAIAEVIQQMWKQHLNIESTLVNQEWKALLETRERGNYQVMRAGWIADYTDPRTFLEVYSSYSGNNHSNWRNPEYDRQLELGNTTMDSTKRFEYYQKAEEILMDELPVVPIYYYKTIYLASPKVKGWNPNLMDIHPYKYIFLDQ